MRLAPAAVAAALALAPGTARAEPRPVPDLTTGCTAEFTEQGDTTWSGQVLGYVAVVPYGAVTLTCSLQSSGYLHSAPDDFAVSASGDVVAVVPPTPFTVPAPPEGERVAVCSRADVTGTNGDTTTYYLNSQNGMWLTHPGTCDGGGQCTALGPQCVWALAVVEQVLLYAEPTVCQVLVAVAPGVPGVVDVEEGTGDTSVLGTPLWECPPYEW